jgi:putative NIF3 family GTP cyclohydrolase 1 type 2
VRIYRMAVRVLSAPLFMAMVALPLAATGQVESDDATVRVGISQFVTHPALDAVREGIIDELAERGWDDIEYDVQNANADIATSRQIATKFRSDGVDVAIGIATPVAQALKATMEGTPGRLHHDYRPRLGGPRRLPHRRGAGNHRRLSPDAGSAADRVYDGAPGDHLPRSRLLQR